MSAMIAFCGRLGFKRYVPVIERFVRSQIRSDSGLRSAPGPVETKKRLDEKSAQKKTVSSKVAKSVATEDSPGEMKELKCMVQ
jgi:hypothetical protein